MRKSNKTASLILKSTRLRPKFGIILGSGFASIQEVVEPLLEIPYQSLPGFPRCSVNGHSGKLIVGTFCGVPVTVLCGRCHFYEGYSMDEVTFPIRVLSGCGIQALLLTNAAGGINPSYNPGDFMCIADHLNLMGINPLRASKFSSSSAFVDLSQTYDPEFRSLFGKAAKHSHIRLHFGVYAAVSGPSYETPAEIRAFSVLGADAVGMSTVPEAIVGRQCKMRIAGLSCITNRAAGLSSAEISHQEVLAAGRTAGKRAATLLSGFIRLLENSKL